MRQQEEGRKHAVRLREIGEGRCKAIEKGGGGRRNSVGEDRKKEVRYMSGGRSWSRGNWKRAGVMH